MNLIQIQDAPMLAKVGDELDTDTRYTDVGKSR